MIETDDTFEKHLLSRDGNNRKSISQKKINREKHISRNIKFEKKFD